MTYTYWIASYDTDGDSDYFITGNEADARAVYQSFCDMDWSEYENNGQHYAVELRRDTFDVPAPWDSYDWSWWDHHGPTELIDQFRESHRTNNKEANVPASTYYSIQYRQTEHRRLLVKATSIEDAIAKWRNSEGCNDEFVSTGDDQLITSIKRVEP